MLCHENIRSYEVDKWRFAVTMLWRYWTKGLGWQRVQQGREKLVGPGRDLSVADIQYPNQLLS
jgi:hypothetical protein